MKMIFFLIALVFSFEAIADAPRIKGAESGPALNGSRTFHVTVRHHDEGWDHYADNFEILDEQGNLIARRILHHPHVNEQPFTRSQSNVTLPKGTKVIQVRAHDKIHGYGPSVKISVPADNQAIRYRP